MRMLWQLSLLVICAVGFVFFIVGGFTALEPAVYLFMQGLHAVGLTTAFFPPLNFLQYATLVGACISLFSGAMIAENAIESMHTSTRRFGISLVVFAVFTFTFYLALYGNWSIEMQTLNLVLFVASLGAAIQYGCNWWKALTPVGNPNY